MKPKAVIRCEPALKLCIKMELGRYSKEECSTQAFIPEASAQYTGIHTKGISSLIFLAARGITSILTRSFFGAAFGFFFSSFFRSFLFIRLDSFWAGAAAASPL